MPNPTLADRPKPDELNTTDPPVLVAILIAARRTGDRMLEAVSRRALERHGIRIAFAQDRRETTNVVS